MLDQRYPSLLPKSPPPLVLSTGTWRRKDRGMWWKDDCGMMIPETVTASDAEKLAAWLREYGTPEERQ